MRPTLRGLALATTMTMLGACSGAGEDATVAGGGAVDQDALPQLFDPGLLSEKLIVNGEFATPDAAIAFPDGSTLVIHVDASGVVAVAEKRPLGTSSMLDIVDELGLEASIAHLAPNIDFRPIADRIAAKQLAAPQDHAGAGTNTPHPEVRDWLASRNLLEAYLGDEELASTAAEPPRVEPLSHNCINWDWFLDDYWGGGSYTLSAECESTAIFKHTDYKNCRFASMNDQGPGDADYTYMYKKHYLAVTYTGTYSGDIDPYYATGMTFTKLVDFWSVKSTCTSVTMADSNTYVHSLSRRWD